MFGCKLGSIEHNAVDEICMSGNFNVYNKYYTKFRQNLRGQLIFKLGACQVS